MLVFVFFPNWLIKNLLSPWHPYESEILLYEKKMTNQSWKEQFHFILQQIQDLSEEKKQQQQQQKAEITNMK